MADDYSPVPGKYKAMKWTASNTEAFKAWVQALTTEHTFAPADWAVQAGYANDGGDRLAVDWTPDTYAHLRMSVDHDTWAVFGPYWGADPSVYWTTTRNSPWQNVSDADFQRQYAAVVS